MSTSYPSSITADEAVARMVNAEALHEGSSVLDDLFFLTEEAETNYEKAKSTGLPKGKIESSERALEICKARQDLARHLFEDINSEFWSHEDSILVRSKDITNRTRYTLDSVANWAILKHGIVIREWLSSDKNAPLTKWMLPDDVTWETIEMRVRKDPALSYFYDDCEFDQKAFCDIGLLDNKTRAPNYQVGILIALSRGEKFPPTRNPDARHRTAISKLRTILRKLTGIKTDPFKPFNETYGWEPNFKLTNDETIADERAKRRARHVGYDDGKDYGVDAPEEGN